MNTDYTNSFVLHNSSFMMILYIVIGSYAT